MSYARSPNRRTELSIDDNGGISRLWSEHRELETSVSALRTEAAHNEEASRFHRHTHHSAICDLQKQVEILTKQLTGNDAKALPSKSVDVVMRVKLSSIQLVDPDLVDPDTGHDVVKSEREPPPRAPSLDVSAQEANVMQEMHSLRGTLTNHDKMLDEIRAETKTLTSMMAGSSPPVRQPAMDGVNEPITQHSLDALESNLLVFMKEALQEGRAMPPQADQTSSGFPMTEEKVRAQGPETTLASPDLRRGVSRAEPMSIIEKSAFDVAKEAVRTSMELENLQAGSAFSWFELALNRRLASMSPPLRFFRFLNLSRFVPDERPKNMLSALAGAQWFHNLTALAVVVNTGWAAYVAHTSVCAVVDNPDYKVPDFYQVVDTSFSVYFALEISIRLLALRLYFFVEPDAWDWNIFDLCLVAIEIMIFFLDRIHLNIMFFRSLRMFRLVRMARFVKFLRTFTEFRKLLFAVFSCVVPLFWAGCFLSIIIFIFSLLILQAVKSEVAYQSDNRELLTEIETNFYGIGSCFKTLLVATVGNDWLPAHETLSQLGTVYGAIMPFFVLVVELGIMNVVIGVFADAAARCPDRHLVSQDHIAEVEGFVDSAVQIFKELNNDDRGWMEARVERDRFREFFRQEELQAFLASHDVDASHPKLIFDLCCNKEDTFVDIHSFVIGLAKLRGVSNHVDVRVLLDTLRTMQDELMYSFRKSHLS